MLDSRVLSDQSLHACMPQGLPAFAGLGHPLEETARAGEFLVGKASKGAPPTPQVGPPPFHGLAMDCTEAVALFLSGLLASSMGAMLLVLSAGTPTCSNTGGVRLHKRPWRPRHFPARLQRLGLHVSPHGDDNVPLPRGLLPKSGGLSWAKVPRPSWPVRRLRRPWRPWCCPTASGPFWPATPAAAHSPSYASGTVGFF